MNNVWSALGPGNWSANGNWSLGVAPVLADDVIFNATSVQNCTIDVSPSVNSITFAAAYSGNWTAVGQTMTCTLGFSHDGTGTSHFGNGLTCNGNASTLHIGAGVGAATGSFCNLVFNGVVAMVFDDDKGIQFNSLITGAGAVLTSSGASTNTFSTGGIPLIIGNASTLTLNTTTNFYSTAAGQLYSTPGAYTFNGTGTITFYATGAGFVFTAPALTFTGTSGNFGFIAGLGTNNAIINQTGNIIANSVGTFRIYAGIANTSFTWNTGGFAISNTGGNLRLGASIATGVLTFNCGASAITMKVYNEYAVGASTINMQTAQFTCAGSWTFGVTNTINPGSSSVTITTTSTVTSNGKSFFDFTVNSGANTVTCADALTLAANGDLTLTTGTLNLAIFNLTVGGDTYVNGVSTLNATGSTCSFAGNYTTAVASTVTINPATNYTFTAVTAIVTNGITLPSCTFNDDFTISDTCIITSLIIGVDGITGTFEAGNIFTITLLAAADWDGALGALNAFRSTIPGTQYTLAIPNALTLQYMNPQDSALLGFQITVDDGTSVDGGNNDANWIWPVVPPVAGGAVGGAQRCWVSSAIGI
jgi:hypothetical protein